MFKHCILFDFDRKNNLQHTDVDKEQYKNISVKVLLQEVFVNEKHMLYYKLCIYSNNCKIIWIKILNPYHTKYLC
jgi:hypothetical protein